VISTEVGLSFIALRSSQARLAIARRNLASQQETLQITRWCQQAAWRRPADPAKPGCIPTD
jgi:outer membrane protein TolC